jgi:hypothetical protein
MTIKGNLLPLGIGSMPFKDINFCIDLIFKTYEQFPYWPQLPVINNYENMYIQYCEGLPSCRINIEKGNVYMHLGELTNEDKEKFYSSILEEKIDDFQISKTFSKGIYALKDYLNKNKPSYEILKGHVTGPVSFSLFLTDENKRSLIYNDEARDIIVELISMKAKWQEKFFNENMIIFFDEPYMVSYGSAFFNMSEDIIVDMFNRVFSSVKGLSGVHCCGNTDWSVILKTSVNIINFDAFLFMDNFLIYADEIKNFIKKGGFLAWGIVPTSEDIRNVSLTDLEKIFNKAVKTLTEKGLELEEIISQSFITPSCGTGSMQEQDALQVFKINKDISDYLRDKYCK